MFEHSVMFIVSAFHETPAPQAIVYGQDMFLNCSVQGLPSATTERVLTKWRLHNLPVSEKTSMFSNGTLFVPHVDKNDTGNYTCTALDSRNNTVLKSDSALVFHACKYLL